MQVNIQTASEGVDIIHVDHEVFAASSLGRTSAFRAPAEKTE